MDEATPSDKKSREYIVLLGPPGAGKSSLGRRLAREFGFAYISTGDIFRDAITRGTPLGQRVHRYLEAGRLVPDRLVEEIMRACLESQRVAHVLLLDGFPRTVAQAGWLDGFLDAQHTPLRLVILVDVDDEVAFRRLSGRRVCPVCGRVYNIYYAPPRVPDHCDMDGARLVQRPDDAPDIVRERLRVYHKTVDLVIDYYREDGRLYRLDGHQLPEAVYEEAIALLREKGVLS